MPKPSRWKRRGPKSTRAGCLLCKPHKRQGAGLKNASRAERIQVAVNKILQHRDPSDV